MAVYKRNYAPYSGRLTSRWPRFFILTRYSYARLFQSRFLMLLISLCLVYPLGCIAFVYLSHNASFLRLINFRGTELLSIDGRFFYTFCVVQGNLACLLTAFTAPALVSPDIVNGGMQLYLCRPFSRAEYVLGKLTGLFLLLSLVTWVPGLLIFVIKSSLAGWGFVRAMDWLAGGLLLGLVIWVLLLSLTALAVSAWVKWKNAAGALLLGIYYIGAGFGTAVNAVFHTNLGSLINLNHVMYVVWADLLRYDNGSETPLRHACVVLVLASALCLWLLSRRVRGFEVVK